MSFPARIVEKFKALWGEERATQKALADHIAGGKRGGAGAALGGAALLDDLASQEEFCLLKVTGLPGQSGRDDAGEVWCADRMRMTWVDLGNGNRQVALAESPEDHDAVRVVNTGMGEIFTGCIGLARFMGTLPPVNPSWAECNGLYMFVAGESMGMPAVLTAQVDDGPYYGWTSRGWAGGLAIKSSAQYSPALCRDSMAWDDKITAPRMAYPSGTPVILRFQRTDSPSPGDGYFWFSGTVDPDHSSCAEGQ